MHSISNAYKFIKKSNFNSPTLVNSDYITKKKQFFRFYVTANLSIVHAHFVTGDNADYSS